MRLLLALGALASVLTACAQTPSPQPLLGFPIFGSAAQTPPEPAPQTTAAIPPPKPQAAPSHPKPAVKNAAAPKTEKKASRKVILVKATPKGPCGAHDQNACKAHSNCAWREPHVRSDGAIVAGYCHAPEAKQ